MTGDLQQNCANFNIKWLRISLHQMELTTWT